MRQQLHLVVSLIRRSQGGIRAMVRVDRVRVPVRRPETVAAAVAMALFYASAHAQSAPGGTAAATSNDEPLQEVVVTGTAIRGAAPVGSNLITIGRTQIDDTNAQTVQQILEMVPS